ALVGAADFTDLVAALLGVALRALDQTHRRSLPLRTTVPGVAARHTTLRNSHFRTPYFYAVLLGPVFAFGVDRPQLLQGRPTRVHRLVTVVVGQLVPGDTALGAQPRAVGPAQRGDRHRQHQRVPNRGLQIEHIPLEPQNLVGVSGLFGDGAFISVQLLHPDPEGVLDGCETPRTLPLGRGLDLAVGEDALAHGGEQYVDGQ